MALLLVVFGVAVHAYLRRGEAAPPANLLPLGDGMTDLGSDTVFDSATAGQGGPRLYYRDMLIRGPKAESAQHLMRREVGVLQRAGWFYSGSIGTDRNHEAILAPAEAHDATSYAYNRARQVCATFDTSSDGDATLARLAAGRHSHDLLWITLAHDPGDIDCSLPTLMREHSAP